MSSSLYKKEGRNTRARAGKSFCKGLRRQRRGRPLEVAGASTAAGAIDAASGEFAWSFRCFPRGAAGGAAVCLATITAARAGGGGQGSDRAPRIAIRPAERGFAAKRF